MPGGFLTPRLVAVLVLLAACGSTTTTKDRCPGVTCTDEGLQLDAATCTCSCGDPVLGQHCSDVEVCTAIGDDFQCLSTRCEGVACDRGTYCDAGNGRCVCGEEHLECADDEYCAGGVCTKPDPCAGVDCAGRGACDPEDARCKCNGEVCRQDESCVEGTCQP